MTTAQKQDPRTKESLGTGRRKTSVARVRLKDGGSGQIVINDRPLDEYFPNIQDRNAVTAPLLAASKRESLDIRIRVEGGGPTGQAGAVPPGHRPRR